VEVKIERLCSRLYVSASIASSSGGGWAWAGRSGSFLTHNNGNIGRKRKVPARHESQEEDERLS
jgi:hypothetical protein